MSESVRRSIVKGEKRRGSGRDMRRRWSRRGIRGEVDKRGLADRRGIKEKDDEGVKREGTRYGGKVS